MKKFKKHIIALLALLTISATGAWAQTETLLTTITNTGENASFRSGSKTFDDIATVTFSGEVYNDNNARGWYRGSNDVTLTVAAASDAYTITRVKFFNDYQDTSAFDEEAPFEAALNTMSVVVNGTDLGRHGVTKIEVYGYSNAPSGPEVTINDTKTEASFDMPQNDVTVTYTLKRDLSVEVGLKVNGKQTWGDDVAKIQVKKQNGEYPTATTLEIVATDLLEDNATIENGNYTLLLQRLNADGETWQDLTLSDAKLTPGTYSITAKAADGTSYVNEAAGKFDIIEGYEVTVAAGEYITYYRDEALTLEETETAAELYTISSVTDKEAVLSSKLTVAPKNTPLLVYNNSNEDKTFLLIPTDAVADNVTAADEFKGTLEATTIPASTTSQDNYALNGKAFVWVKNAIEVGANKCWLQIGEQPAATRANTRSITGNGDTTGVETIDNGQLTIDNYYDLNGRKVAMPNKKGIYIKNGQKVVVK